MPDQPQALYLLAAVAHQRREHASAARLLERAVARNPRFARAHGALAVALRHEGRFEEALVAHRRAIALEPTNVGAQRALAATLVARGDVDAAVATYRIAQEMASDTPDVAAEFAALLRRLGRNAEAVAVCRDAVVCLPDSSAAHGLLAIELHRQGQLEESVVTHRRAIALAPESAVAWTNLGVTLHALGDLHAAIASHEKAVAIDPHNGRAHQNRALALMGMNRLEEALVALRSALVLGPGNADVHWDYALALLAAGELREGWQEFEWRWETAAFPSVPRHTHVPRWDGSALSGRRLMLWAEQGLGDTIQFARYAALLTCRGERVVLECAAPLRRLLRSLPGIEAVVSRDEHPGSIDVALPLLTMPLLFGTTLRSIPARTPYLSPEPADRERWAGRLSPHRGMRVGIVWAGSPTHANDRHRSLDPSLLAPLLGVSGVQWFGLQVGARERPAGPLVDLAGALGDLAETAAVIANLDLTITVDTAVAHLAGALGAPVWVLLPYAADWRWMRERPDSPWYPSMRLFRQPTAGRWETVLARVTDALGRHAQHTGLRGRL